MKNERKCAGCLIFGIFELIKNRNQYRALSSHHVICLYLTRPFTTKWRVNSTLASEANIQTQKQEVRSMPVRTFILFEKGYGIIF